MDAWLKQSSISSKRPTAATDYSRWNNLKDSDDEDDGDTEHGAPTDPQAALERSLPPHVRAAMATSQAALAAGDHAAAAKAQRELEGFLSNAPPEFQAALRSAQASRTVDDGVSATRETVRDGREALERAKPSVAKLSPNHAVSADAAELDRQLSALDQAQELLSKMTDDPSRMPEWLAAAGLSESDLKAAEESADPSAAMQALAERALAMTVGRAVPPPVSAEAAQSLSGGKAGAAGGDARAAALAAKRREVERRVREAKAAREREEEEERAAAAAAAAGEGMGTGEAEEEDEEEIATPSVRAERRAARRAGKGRAKRGEGGARGEESEVASRLMAQRAKMAAAEAEVAAQLKAAEQAKVAVDRARAELAKAEDARTEQGKKVDASVQGAALSMEAEAKARAPHARDSPPKPCPSPPRP